MTLPPVLQDRLRLPVVASPMFIVSGPDLVINQCVSGIVGSFPSLNARPQPVLREWLIRITEELAKYDANNPETPSAPYAVNLIVHKSNDRLEEDLATVVEFKVPIVITSLGARIDVNEAVHSYGGIVLHDVINNTFARKAVEKGVDGLIAVAAGAGGHAGIQSPFALIQEIREWFDGPLVLSGSIAHGRSVLAAQAAGADLAYVGSAFIASTEATADAGYKQMIVDSTAEDIIHSNLFTGIHGNYLRGSIEAVGLDPNDLATSDPASMNFAIDESLTSATSDAKPWRDIWGAGQGIGAVDTVTTASDIVGRLSGEYAEARTALLQG
ncbi:nitronate monooxygenase family protein [Rhodococcus sp. (in: high G+C Gram-positive bacteria)]|uniref:NAD(P)H-dependent flavin oxidoreductase n=1 Tax=Rhodococcus sp. TaxID=1831 RepID=UPI00257FEC9B|nr:nitronate monooxygenase family protein [Rhodococcus sp. (in: high G+C Gram-positive bacteria)]MBQ9052647.1 nitronate monooxygenase [Rhodococcus sp. (in: high G+C Gram-positive bacteria)]